MPEPRFKAQSRLRTRKTQTEFDLKELKAWPEIPALQNASGVGVYTTSFELPANWTKAHGARLSLGEVFDTFTVTVNNQPVALDQLSAEGDIGAFLKAGRNTIAVRVGTTLNNRLVKLDDDVAKRGMMQPYGLVGPVVLTPYGQAAVK
jgi:beta-galactosidase/beta-glucuronidase